MLKSFSFLARKPGLSSEAFLHHWIEVHAPMWRSVPGIRGYVLGIPVQNHSRADVAGLSMDPFDGVAQVWFDDLASRAAAAASPEGKAWHADGGSIIGQIRTFVTEEEVAVPLASPRPAYRALSLVQRKPGASTEAFQHHWRRVHAPMAATVPELGGFVVSTVIEEQFRADLPSIPMEGPIDGFAESWINDLEARARMIVSPEAKHWFADGASLFGKVKTVVLEDRVMAPPPA
jgi:uncharacterized protein (TIGR02118 family)